MTYDLILLRMRFEEDAPFTESGECYADKQNGKVYFLGAMEEHKDTSWGREDFLRFLTEKGNNPDRFIPVPATTHEEWHTVFSKWYQEVFKEAWVLSTISGTLKELSEETQWAWENYRFDYAEQKALDFVSNLR